MLMPRRDRSATPSRSPAMASSSATIAAISRPAELDARDPVRGRDRRCARRDRTTGMPVAAELHEFRPDAELDARPAPAAGIARGSAIVCAAEPRPRALDSARQDVHAGRADEIADEGVRRPLEQLGRRADLHDLAVVHHDDLVGEGQRLGLVVRDIDHGEVEARGAAAFSCERSSHFRCGSMTVSGSSNRIAATSGADQAAAERDLLLHVGRQLARLAARACARDRACRAISRDPRVDRRLRHAAVLAAGRRGSRGPSWCRRRPGTGTPARCCAPRVGRSVTSLAVEQERPRVGVHEAGDDVEQRGLAAAGRAEQRIGAALLARRGAISFSA